MAGCRIWGVGAVVVAVVLVANACARPQLAAPPTSSAQSPVVVTPIAPPIVTPNALVMLSPTPSRSPAAPEHSPTPPLPSPSSTLPPPSPTSLPSFARPTETRHTPGPSPTPISTRGPLPTPTFGPDARGRAIVIDQDRQTLTVYEGGRPLRVIPCSTGQPDRYPTPPWTGVVGYYRPWFESFGTRADDAWWLFRDWDGNYYIHSLPYTVENGQKVYQDREFLGQRPVSHGCIRISPEDAEWLTWWNPLGVPITITPMTRTDWG